MTEIWVGKVIGQLGPNTWVQVHDFVPEDEQKLAVRGRLLATISLTSGAEETEIGMVSHGREILARLHELYYGETADPILDQLKMAVETTRQEQTENQLEITCLVVTGGIAYIVSAGGGVWAKKQQAEGFIVDPQDPSTGVHSLSGRLQPGQVLVVGNHKFWQGLPLGVIKAGIESDDQEGMIETLGTVVAGSQKSQGAVGMVIKVMANDQGLMTNVAEEESEEVGPEVVSVPVVPPPSPPIPAASPGINLKDRLFWLADKLPHRSRPIYLAQDRSTKKTMYAGIGFLVILLLLAGGWQLRRQQLNAQALAQNSGVEELVFKFREAEALVDLNPSRSRELLDEVSAQIAQINEAGGKKDARVAEIEAGLPAVLGAATGTRQVQPEEVLDLNLIRDSMTGSRLRLAENGLVVLDTGGHRLVTVDPAKKKGEVVAGIDNLGQTTLLATYPGKIEVVSDKGIVECTEVGEQCSVKVSPDEGWGELVDMGMFGGNIYLLSKQGIWRHQVTESGFGARQKWLADGESEDFGLATNMAIDSSIWTITSSGEIAKYTRGVKDNFALEPLDQSLGNQLYLFTSEDIDKLYVLDRQNNRVVVFDKTGVYDQQYVFDQAKDTTSLVVDRPNSKMYLLAGAKIWAVGL